MDNSSSILEIVYRVKDEASAKIKEIGDNVEQNSKQAVDMGQAFQVAGGILLGVGAAGVGIMKMLTDASMQHQVAMANVDTTLKNVSQTIATHTVLVGGNSASVKANKSAIDDHIRSLKEQKLQYETMGGAHKSEIDSINNEIKAQELLKLRADDVTVSKSHLVTITDGAIGSFTVLKNTADQLADAYLKLGFADHDTELAFAQDLRVTKDVTDAKTMLSISADLARLKNISLTDATTAMTRAYEGNTKVLKSLGIEVDKGAKGMDVLTAVQKAAAGQADAYSHTYAGAMEILNVNFEKLKVTLGDRLLPMFTGFVNSLVQLIEGLNNLNPKTYDSIISILKFGTVFSLTSGAILEFVANIKGAVEMISSFNPEMRAVIIILAIVATIGSAIYANWSKIAPVFKEMGQYVSDLGLNLFPQVNKQLTDFLVKNLQPVAAFFIANFLPIIQSISAEFMQTFLPLWKQLETQLIALQPLFEFLLKVVGGFIVAAFIAAGLAITGLLLVVRTMLPVFTMIFFGLTTIIAAFLKIIQDIGITIGAVFSEITGNHLPHLSSSFHAVLTDIESLVNIKIAGIISPWKSMQITVLDIVNTMASGINAALHKIVFPHIAIGTGDIKVAGHDIQYPNLDVKWYQNGGFVPDTGLAMLHQGEFVMSKAMLAGRQPSPIDNRNFSNNPSVTIQSVNVRNESDIDTLVKKLTHAMKYDTSY